jgi:hypothetical protein
MLSQAAHRNPLGGRRVERERGGRQREKNHGKDQQAAALARLIHDSAELLPGKICQMIDSASSFGSYQA